MRKDTILELTKEKKRFEQKYNQVVLDVSAFARHAAQTLVAFNWCSKSAPILGQRLSVFQQQWLCDLCCQ